MSKANPREGRSWPAYLFGGRLRTSTLALIVAFMAIWWIYETYQPAPEPPPQVPAADVVPPGFIPDPAYTWVPRTYVQRPTTTTTTPTTPTTPTTTTTPTTPESSGPPTASESPTTTPGGPETTATAPVAPASPGTPAPGAPETATAPPPASPAAPSPPQPAPRP